MTVSATNSLNGPYVGNGATTVFPFAFNVAGTDEVSVITDGVLQSAGFSVAINANQSFNPGGSVTFASPPASGVQVIIASNPSFAQETSFEDAGQFLPSTHDAALDEAARRDIYLRARSLRSVIAPLGEEMDDMPGAAERAGKFLTFDAGGNPVVADVAGSDASLRSDLAASGGAALAGFIQSGAGAATRTVLSKLRDILNVNDRGAVGDGTTDDRAAFALADAIGAFEISANHRIASNITISSPVRFTGNGRLTVDAGVTVTFRSEVDGPARQLFYGSGSVVGIRDVCPEWFGAVRNGTTDDLAALNKAHACVQGSKDSRGGRQRIRLLGGTYGVSATWVVSPSAYVNLALEGTGIGIGGSRITDIAAFASTTTPVVHIDGQTDSIQRITDFALLSYAVVKGAGAATIGLQVGSTSSAKALIGEGESLIDNVFATGFANNFKFCHINGIEIPRLFSWNSAQPVLITVNGGFTGGISFGPSCRLVSTSPSASGARCVRIEALTGTYDPVTGNNSIGGIRFGRTEMFYGERALEVVAKDGCMISDIWLDGTQFDQDSVNKIYIEANKNTANTPVIRNVHLKNTYLEKSTGDQITLASISAGVIQNVQVSGNWQRRAQLSCFKASGTGITGVSVNDNHLVDNNYHNGSTGYAIDLGTTIGAVCRGNILEQTDGTSTCDYMVRIALGANHYFVRGNVAQGKATVGVVLDSGGAVTKSVGDNI